MKIKRSLCIIILLMLIVMCNCCKSYAYSGQDGRQPSQWDGPNAGGDSGTFVQGSDILGLPTINDEYKPQISLGTEDNRVTNIISTVLSFLTIIGICVIVVAISVIGFDTMLGSANEKAIAKEKYVGLCIAAVLLVGASSLARIIIKFAEGI